MTLLDDLLPKLDKLALSFDVQTLLHPIVIHFLMALPVVALLLELMNLIMKKKAVSGVSFFLILLTVVAAFGAFVTGIADGKDAALTDAAKTALGDHKLLGTYLMLGSALVLLLKLLSFTGSKIFKGLYLVSLIGLMIIMFKQGDDGGKLVYEHGLNVQAVKTLDTKVFELEDVLEDAQIGIKELKQSLKIANEKLEEEKAKVIAPVVVPESSVAPTAVEMEVKPTVSPVESTGIETVGMPVTDTVIQPVVTPEVVIIPAVQ